MMMMMRGTVVRRTWNQPPSCSVRLLSTNSNSKSTSSSPSTKDKPKNVGRPKELYFTTKSGIVFKNPNKIKENIKNYLIYIKTKDLKEMYFTHRKIDRTYKCITRKAAHMLFHPDFDYDQLKFPLFYTTKEPKQWNMCRIDNYLFYDKKTKNQYLLDAKSLFLSAVRVTSQNVQLLVLLKTAQQLREKAEAGGAGVEAAAGDAAVPAATSNDAK